MLLQKEIVANLLEMNGLEAQAKVKKSAHIAPKGKPNPPVSMSEEDDLQKEVGCGG